VQQGPVAQQFGQIDQNADNRIDQAEFAAFEQQRQ
jgi:hypothetical protein